MDETIMKLFPKLRRVREEFWTIESNAEVSYPDDAHTAYAAIEENSYWFKHRNRCIVSLFRMFNPTGPLIDVGGGNGIVSLALKKAGFTSIATTYVDKGACWVEHPEEAYDTSISMFEPI